MVKKLKLLKLTVCLLAVLFALFILSCSSEETSTPTPAESVAPTATAAPTATTEAITEEGKLEQIKQDIHNIEIDSSGAYYKSWAFLDRMEESLDTGSIMECAPTIHARVYDEKGNIIYEYSAQSPVYGAYVFGHKILYPSFETPPPPPRFPGMSEQEYEEIIRQYEESIVDPSTLKRLFWIEWERIPIDPENEDGNARLITDFLNIVNIEDELISEKLDELGIILFRRTMAEQKHPRPKCFDTAIGAIDSTEKGAVSMHVERIEYRDAVIGSHISQYSGAKHGFYLQGSFLKNTLGAPIFAFKKEAQKPELVGILTQTGAPLESRGFAANINYILELLELAGIDITETPEEP